MKKYFLVIVIVLLLCACGGKNKKIVKPELKNEKNTIGIGVNDLKFMSNVTCGDKTSTSYVLLNKDKTAKYVILTCNDNDINMITSEGSYTFDNNSVTLLDNYQVKWNMQISDKNLIVNYNNETINLELISE